jgi:hypothetical protein
MKFRQEKRGFRVDLERDEDSYSPDSDGDLSLFIVAEAALGIPDKSGLLLVSKPYKPQRESTKSPVSACETV